LFVLFEDEVRHVVGVNRGLRVFPLMSGNIIFRSGCSKLTHAHSRLQ